LALDDRLAGIEMLLSDALVILLPGEHKAGKTPAFKSSPAGDGAGSADVNILANGEKRGKGRLMII
jgi:hypothetical protein